MTFSLFRHATKAVRRHFDLRVAQQPLAMQTAQSLEFLRNQFLDRHFLRAYRAKCVYGEGHRRLTQIVQVPWTDEELEAALRGDGDELGLIHGKETQIVVVVFTIARSLRQVGLASFKDGAPTRPARAALGRVNKRAGMQPGFTLEVDGGFAAAYVLDEKVATIDAVAFMERKIEEADLPSKIVSATVSGTSEKPFFVPPATALRTAELLVADEVSNLSLSNSAGMIKAQPQPTSLASETRIAIRPISDPFFAAVDEVLQSYFSGTRQPAASELFAWIVQQASEYVPRDSRFGLNAFPLSSRRLASLNSEYRSYLDVLTHLGIVEVVSGFSAGCGCHTATSTRFVLHRVKPPRFDRDTVFAKLRETPRSYRSIARELEVNVRTLQRWLADPDRVDPRKVLRLNEVLG